MEIDKNFQIHGQLPDYSTVNTIEHIIPQQLDKVWKEYLGKEADDEHFAGNGADDWESLPIERSRE